MAKKSIGQSMIALIALRKVQATQISKSVKLSKRGKRTTLLKVKMIPLLMVARILQLTLPWMETKMKKLSIRNYKRLRSRE